MSTDPGTPALPDADPAEQNLPVDRDDADDATTAVAAAELPEEADAADVLDQRSEIGWGEERGTTD